MKNYTAMTNAEVQAEKTVLQETYDTFKAKGLKLNIARGLPSPEQLNLAMPMLDILTSHSDFHDENGMDCRNFGGLRGIAEARKLFGEYMGAAPEEMFIAGSSSVTFMFEVLASSMFSGVRGSEKPWKDYEKIKWLCPVPGYDRHFKMCEFLGIEMLNIPLRYDGPDMGMVEKLVQRDDSIKGIWCNPKYSNPAGCCYSDEVVRRLASMQPAAKDFRIFWDNSYAVHAVYKDIPVLNLLEECKKAGCPDRAYMFGSTSKFTIPGAAVSFLAASKENIDFVADQMNAQAISWDKMNMLRHVRFLKDMENIRALMAKHADILRPRFDAALEELDRGLSGTGAGQWVRPDGGYFITFKGLNGTAKRIVQLCREAGVLLTDAGATHPYHNDPEDAYIRLAPSYLSVEDIHTAMALFCVATRLAALEKLV